MKIKDITISNDLLEHRIIRWAIKIITYPTWRWCNRYGNWYLYNPKHFRATDNELIPIHTDKIINIPISSEPGDCRFMFVNCNKLINL